MCLNSSSSSSSSKSTNVYDERVGADGGATAFRAEGTNSINVGSDDVSQAAIFASNDSAQMAIESSTNALTASTDFLANAFTAVLNLTDKRLDRADQNNASITSFAEGVIGKSQESSDDRLIKLFQMIAVGGVAVVALKSGFLKDLKGVFK